MKGSLLVDHLEHVVELVYLFLLAVAGRLKLLYFSFQLTVLFIDLSDHIFSLGTLSKQSYFLSI
jgi:hypothetical protein